MLALSIHSPFASDARLPERVAWADAVRHARAEAASVSGAYADQPFSFRSLGPEVAPLLARARPLGSGAGRWVLVTVRGSGETGHRTHLRERCLTAAQRFMLSLACDGIESQWVDDAVPPTDDLREAGVDLGLDCPVGLIWCEPER